MSVNRRTLIPITGNTSVSSAAINGVRILMVARSGDVRTDVSPATPAAGSLEFKYLTNRIYFPSDLPFILGEKVIVIFET